MTTLCCDHTHTVTTQLATPICRKGVEHNAPKPVYTSTCTKVGGSSQSLPFASVLEAVEEGVMNMSYFLGCCSSLLTSLVIVLAAWSEEVNSSGKKQQFVIGST